MWVFWDAVVEPLLNAARPRSILEIGFERGDTTGRLIAWARDHEAIVDAIDSSPSLDVERWRAQHEGVLRLHVARSLEALPRLEAPADVVLIDGDHNWYTVVHELRALERRAVEGGVPVPIFMLHDLQWPYARRDLYYDPESIPAEHRHPHARKGLVPGRPDLVAPGFNDHLNNALHEGGPRNGVATAVEDFVAESSRTWRLHVVPGDHGLGVLIDAERLEEEGRLRDFLDHLGSPDFLALRCADLERERVETRIQATRARRELEAARADVERLEDAATAAPVDPGELDALRAELAQERQGARGARVAGEELRADLADADRRAARLERRLAAAESREEELDGALRELRSRLRTAELERDESAVERELATARAHRVEEALTERVTAAQREAEERLSTHQREADDRLTALQRGADERLAGARREADDGLAEVRRQAEHDIAQSHRRAEEAAGRAAVAEAAQKGLTAELDQALANRARLIADLEDARDSLEDRLEEARRQGDTAREAASELREALEARELEREDLGARAMRLEAELGAARADLEIAEAERAASERRLAELVAENQRLTAIRSVSPAPRVAPSVPPPPPGSTTVLSAADSVASAASEAPPAPAELPAPERAGLTPPAEPVSGPVSEPVVAVKWLPTELEAQERFRAEYVDAAVMAPDGRDLTALPSAHDRRGILLGPSEGHPEGRPRVDVIVCVHNALEDVRLCLWALVEKTAYPFHLIVVDDGSDADTVRYLDELAASEPRITLIRNSDPPHGYTIAANLGLRAASGDYLVLLNSDTIVTPQWLDRIVDCGDAEPGVGILGPLSNAASHQSIPELRAGGAWATNPPPGYLPLDAMGLLLEYLSRRRRPRLPFINGFCYVIKRAVIDAIGYLDEENFASGYCEENDLSHRAALAGFELAVVDDAYVFHAKSKSFSVEGRKVLARRNYEIFLDKHGRELINTKVAALEANTEMGPLRAVVGDALSSPGALAAALDLHDRDPLRVVFVLPGLGDGGSGGSHSIYQEVRGLRQLGVPARIALAERAWSRAVRTYDDAHEIFETFSDIEELADRTQDADVISATHFKSVEMVAALRERRDDFLPAYYIQDYEPFFTSRDSADIEEAIRSYTLIDDCLLFAKTHWLCNIVGERHDRHVAKVEPSIDERLFVGSERLDKIGPLHVVAMVRPRTPRRQPTATVAVLDELARALGGRVDISTFGCHDRDLEAVGASPRLLRGHRGLLRRAEVADLLSGADVFLDLSMYQAFGRTALEAMACGCTAVVPRHGGAWEFVEDGVNAIAMDAFEPDTALEALLSLADDPERVRAMQRAARATASRYSIMRAALSEYLVFAQANARRFSRTRESA